MPTLKKEAAQNKVGGQKKNESKEQNAKSNKETPYLYMSRNYMSYLKKFKGAKFEDDEIAVLDCFLFISSQQTKIEVRRKFVRFNKTPREASVSRVYMKILQIYKEAFK